MESSHRYLEPIGCIKIAQDAADHNPYSPLSYLMPILKPMLK